MVKIRLRRVGAKKQPSYRVVVADSRSPRDGRFIEVIGHYNPRTDPPEVVIKAERALYWLQVGAQPTEAVERLLRWQGILEAFSLVKSGMSPADALAQVQQQMAAAAAEAAAEKPEEEAAAEEQAAEAEPEQVPPEALPLSDLELSESVFDALSDAGITTVGDLVARLSEGDAAILSIPGIGGAALAEIKDKLAEMGLVNA